MQRVLFGRLCRLSFKRFAANRDWKPGPYPRTKEECDAAAAKYGLLPEDYKPLPDDGMAVGDYPDIQPVASDERDPYVNWDDPFYRRDFGEIFHQRGYEWYHPNRIGTLREFNRRPSKIVAWFFLPWITFISLLYFTRDFKYSSLMLPKQNIYNALMGYETHYTFDPIQKEIE